MHGTRLKFRALCYKMLQCKNQKILSEGMGMKRNKLIALLLTSVMAAGAVASCDSTVDPSTSETATETSVTSVTSAPTPTDVPPDLEGYRKPVSLCRRF